MVTIGMCEPATARQGDVLLVFVDQLWVGREMVTIGFV